MKRKKLSKRPFEQWSQMIRKIRNHFDQNGYLEVFTSHLVSAGAFEANIQPLSSGKWELHTSPEIQMKALLSDLQCPIYQIARCFRDDPTETGVHLKEFTMLEFYRPFASSQDVCLETQRVIEELNGEKLDWKVISLSQSTEVLKLQRDVPQARWEEQFERYLVDVLESSLDKEKPTVVKDFPLFLSPLSKATEVEGFAERFEIYWRGLELANGCAELTDPLELKRRFEDQNRRRAEQSKQPHLMSLLLKEEFQIPPSSGVALGLERLATALRVFSRMDELALDDNVR